MNEALRQAMENMQTAKTAWDAAKTKKAMRDAREDFEFWSDKAAMLEVMSRKF